MSRSRITSARVARDGWVVTLSGEVDLPRARALERELERAIGEGRRRVVVDLGATSYVGPTAVAACLGARDRLRSRGGSLVLVADERRILRASGSDELPVAVAPTLTAALAVVAGAQ